MALRTALRLPATYKRKVPLNKWAGPNSHLGLGRQELGRSVHGCYGCADIGAQRRLGLGLLPRRLGCRRRNGHCRRHLSQAVGKGEGPSEAGGAAERGRRNSDKGVTTVQVNKI